MSTERWAGEAGRMTCHSYKDNKWRVKNYDTDNSNYRNQFLQKVHGFLYMLEAGNENLAFICLLLILAAREILQLC